MDTLQKQCEEIKLSSLRDATANLPEAQRLMIETCFDCAKRKRPEGNRQEHKKKLLLNVAVL